ncbi:hypothetical protein GR173_001167 [Salmonella enterica subsp. enterica]|uniref:Uncharacterized protein n=1 Tax=Salmonella enterica subsp. enterica serovar Mapo TaxID=2564752 RepID=A0A5H7IJU4_SALET|nr:hypothetical protein [Salmonella enterica]ECD4527329.1 hypothetical protein [Salmonella enterica subsp. enterica serovar Mapo]EDH6257269.1 hypothetical protein [Salmonella enterica subsp. enterica serovar Agbeni]EDS6805994.1 hypothetical protein [Salmonella enterica subsp. enterica serovar Legon]EDU0167799.1 hypothetical protein [Salmonella enterica subsp. enterica serovar Belfast]EED9363901.1 hypothetical protein [Salmonella enterica subsp. enterica serovar Ituri]EEI9689285.1 hypothetical
MDISKDRSHSLIKFLGFTGVAAIISIAVSLGKTQQVIADTSAQTKQSQRQIDELTADIRVEQQELVDVDRRVTRLEDKQSAN